jgi:hypothetical protein
MERFDDASKILAPVEMESSAEGLRITGMSYDLLFAAGRPYVHMADKQGNTYAEFSLFGGIDKQAEQDETLTMPVLACVQGETATTIRISSASTVWHSKDQVWVCRPGSIEVYYEVEGKGDITRCTYFAGQYADETMSGQFASNAQFKSVFNPEPTSSEQRTHLVSQSSSINVTGLSRSGMEDWFFTPAPYCFGASLQMPGKKGRIPDGPWMMMGVAAPIEQQHFTGVHYDGLDHAFSLRLEYEGHTRVDGSFRSPSVLLHFADDPYEGLAQYAANAASNDLLSTAQPHHATADWWKEPIYCGWGSQVELAGEYSDVSVQDFATQLHYDRFMQILADHNLQPGTITIDDKWQRTYGENKADPNKWANLGDWIERRHQLGQKVLLWLKAWDSEGLAPELCVTTKAGSAVTVDPSNSEYQDQLRQQVTYMLSESGYNADGFKIDFTARTPTGSNLRRHGKEWGTSLLHRYLKTIYDQAKQTKPDALIVAHTPSPYFSDIADMIRLNDVNCNQSVREQMKHRAKVVNAACPELLIDTDNWPMPSLETWRKYAKQQPKLGVMALYFTTMVGGQPLHERDYEMVGRIWTKWRRQNGLTTFLS